MQLKRDTEYALRIMISLAEYLKEEGGSSGISSAELISGAGIPKISFNRICKSLEEKGLILKKTDSEGNVWVCPGRDFWDQSIFSIGMAVEGNMDIFAVFDRRSEFMKKYGEKLKETQKNLTLVLSEETLKNMAESKHNI